ncbi:BRO family protein [Azospirillum doebereinerae]|nr:phage antirepressor KilAC domain-containing protein [Azospirillum doebereinerae]
MSGNLIPFNFEDVAVRVIDRNGEPWFVLTDVCVVLGIGSPHKAAERLDEEDKTTLDTRNTNPATLGIEIDPRAQSLTIVNESGLWSLVLTSRKPSAKRFKKWITAEVIPTIRKTGSYGTPTPQLDLNDPAQLRSLLLGYSEKLETTQAALVEAEKVAEVATGALDRIAGADGTLTATQAAKDLQVPRHVLLTYMRTNRWVYRPRGCADDIPYQDKIEAGYLTLKVETVPRGDGTEKIIQRARITSKGLTKLAQVVPGARKPGGNNHAR